MLVAAAVCPCPPLLVPDVAAGAAPELDAARDACADAVGLLAASRPDLLVVVGPAEQGGTFRQGAVGSFAGYGVDVRVRLGRGESAAAPSLPVSLAVGAWLLERAGWADTPVEGLAVAEGLDPKACVAAGEELASRADRVALLVMGDGSACRTLKAPGYLDERAAGFDEIASAALGSADTAALMGLDDRLAHELKVAGRAPWQVLAGAGSGAALAGRLLHEGAPYGVGYFVGVWS
ncbi:class III extradiol dioxygenase subunit B-like domain-containing protein [Streptomyces sp. MBT27]|uniref:class III extradiol dioxygenase subunit B-like domain-containing protein n=1 Tax=Streptomyces sp. MBT27 TaxID=1488356 RepID=UPI00141FC11F|nr:class III extradiol dioxygenase subunit B-like domain-containing protein [Streptomyces sp. MBT27]